jgi:hypothetical protein
MTKNAQRRVAVRLEPLRDVIMSALQQPLWAKENLSKGARYAY